MTRGAGFWPGGRERSVPHGFPGSDDADTVEQPRPRPRPSPRKRTVPRADAARNHEAAARGRRLHPAASLLAAAWPGQSESSVPADFPGRPGGGKIVFTPPADPVLAGVDPEVGEVVLRAIESDPDPDPAPSPADAIEVEVEDTQAPAVVLPTKRRTTRDERQQEAQAKVAARAKADRKRRPSPIRPPKRFNDVVAAVYAALADPLAADTAEAREERAARVREVGLLAASTALVAVLIYGIFPVRTFLDQRASTSEAEERLEKLSEHNERLERQAEKLLDDDEVEMRAREDYGWVYPGDELYGVTPPPAAPTTSTTTEP